jgi:hypothetical protein
MATAPEQPSRTVVLKDAGLRQFEGGFTSIPNRILENNDLSLGARMTYAMLLKYAWQKDFCFPAQQKLAQDLGITDRSVRTFLTELRDRALVDWKQQGLNRPNIYYILKLPERVTSDGGGHSGPEDFSAPERNHTSTPDRNERSGQERKPGSDKEYPTKNTHNVDNVEQLKPGKEDSKGRQLTRDEYGRAKGLALQIQDTIGQPENYASYFVRAGEAVRRGSRGVQALMEVLAATKDVMQRGRLKKTPSQYFHRVWERVLPGLGLELQPKLSPEDLTSLEDDPERGVARLAVQDFLNRSRSRTGAPTENPEPPLRETDV